MKLSDSILSTLAYHDIFDYPLNLEEVKNLLIQNKSETSSIKKTLKALTESKRVGESKGLFYLRGRKKIVEIRGKRTTYSKDKYKKAKFYLSILKNIPSVKLIAITGALAMNNSTKNDDIDLLIVTAKKTLWTTRFLANLVLLPYKRKPSSKKQKDKACLNVFINESNLHIKEKNLYTAHEMAQLVPLFERNRAYLKFIKANNWIQEYLPSWKPEFSEEQSKVSSIQKLVSLLLIPVYLLPTERLFRSLQLSYMKSKITTEKIGNNQLFFHPSNTQTRVLEKYEKKLNHLTM